MVPNVPPVLLSDGLRLRPWSMVDVELFHTIWGDPRVIWWGENKDLSTTEGTLSSVLERIRSMPAGMGWWAVESRDSGAMLGNVVFRPAPYDKTAELGYHLAHAAWGQGIATRAAVMVLRHGFTTLAVPEVSAVVHVDNAPSHAVATRLGLRDTGPIEYNKLPHRRYALTAGQAQSQAWWVRPDTPVNA